MIFSRKKAQKSTKMEMNEVLCLWIWPRPPQSAAQKGRSGQSIK
jgi:hypothetical protein